MTFYNPSNSTFTRHYREEVEMVFSGFDCALRVFNGKKAIYCSSELTTGLRLYKVLRKHHLKTASELKKTMGRPWFKKNIFDANKHSAIKFARSVRSKSPANTLIITPAPFNAPEWTQPQYLRFWKTLIRTRVKAVWFNKYWEFSNGCTFELAVALDAGVATCDHRGATLGRKQAIQCLESAIAKLGSEGFDTAKLRANLKRLLVASNQRNSL
jgi:hypothetical protein